MGKNLLSYERPFKQIEIDAATKSLSSMFNDNQIYNDIISKRIEELKALKRKAIQAEDAAYAKFKDVNSIEDLQAKIDEINSNLQSFTNEALRKMPIIKNLEAVTYKEIEDKLKEEILGAKTFQEVVAAQGEEMVDQKISEFVNKIGRNVKYIW